jgi:hypothetical protein
MSDHSSVLLSPSAPSSRERIPKKLIQFRACNPSNKGAIQRFLNTYDWSTVSDLESCTEKLDCFMSIVQSALNMFIPIRTIKVHHNDKPWMTQKIKDLMSKRQKAWTKGLSFTYKFYRSRCIHECKQACRRFYEEKVNNNGNVNPSKTISRPIKA